MKKISALLIMTLSFAFMSCSKVPEAIVNNNEQNKALPGIWHIITQNEIAIYSDPSNEDTYEADVITRKTMEMRLGDFGENQAAEYSIITSQHVLSYDALIDNPVIKESEIKDQLEDSITISGTYAADKKYIQFNAEKVIFSDGTEQPFVEVIKVYPEFGKTTSILEWNVTGESLTVTDPLNKAVQITYTAKH